MATAKSFQCYRAVAFAVFVASMPFGCRAQYNIQSMETKVLRKLIDPDGYDRQIRPAAPHRYPLEHNPLGVEVDVSVMSLHNIDVQTMDFTINLSVGLKWIDNRLNYDHTIPYLTLTEPHRIWMPNIVISNAKRVSYDNGEYLFTRIYPRGAVHHKKMLTVVATCSMDLKYFPFDEQKCEVIFSSFLYTNDILTFNWSTEHPIDVIEGMQANSYDLAHVKGEECVITTNAGDHSCVKLVFSLKRESGNMLIRVFIPCSLYVFVSWFALWINSKQTLLRLLIPLITLMTMTSNLSSMAGADVPRTPYTKAVDVWTGICVSFVFVFFSKWSSSNT
ncbi:glutamate-gated chloride channel-like [Ornithodoros turicata]|uniref:glutamate-gated chloride channel-like n=1 Tax=Ornithodoros turicata TaxID=34597 RepID=UPI0031392CBD